MLVLALDTSTPAVTAALYDLDAGAPLASRVTVDPRRHGELLGPFVRDVLAEALAAPRDLAAVAVGLGPGPFTGLRVGLVTAAAFADALGVPAYGSCSLDAIATPGEPLLVATDARRREVYWAVYDSAATRIAGPAVDRPDVAAARASELGAVAMAGAGAEQYAGVLGLPLRAARYPDPARLVELARDRIVAGAPTEPLTPLYLRRPDAETPGAPKPVLR